ncbi:very-long-chain 3-oxoacyl-CoA reductase 1 [Amborella trichopoda]|uniref:very-long-chain 3-oxoacyl-CoA reductase 1 n=1 Tax=Amborella trichopoda TaxID=13333 RepID=UPI0005D41592|nr:very-long-chain 3-oxoacyl-CoA reductase 1 [Amborella trichopoda]|eukprot:XP_006852268.2 very-long-chain 3-oxoacyl-CoA reductase 1 [Amborella trichopoda]
MYVKCGSTIENNDPAVARRSTVAKIAKVGQVVAKEVRQLQRPSIFLPSLLILGSFSLYKTLSSLLKWLWAAFLRPPKNLRRSYGPWAIITGPTDGIGKALAFELARNGLNLVMVGRNSLKLSEISAQIEATYGRVVKNVVVDFSADLEAGLERIREGIKGLEIGVLVNNVGVTYPNPTFFDEADPEVVERVIRVNVEGSTGVTKVVMDGMVKRRRGAIVFVGSGAASVAPSFPLVAVYAASKAYIDQFSRSLYVEYKPHGIDVQCQIPLYVATKMTSVAKPSWFAPTPEVYVSSCLGWVGYEARCIPYLPHAIQSSLACLLPDALLDWLLLRRYLARRQIGISQGHSAKKV